MEKNQKEEAVSVPQKPDVIKKAEILPTMEPVYVKTVEKN